MYLGQSGCMLRWQAFHGPIAHTSFAPRDGQGWGWSGKCEIALLIDSW